MCVRVFIKHTTVACVHSINATVTAMMNYHSAFIYNCVSVDEYMCERACNYVCMHVSIEYVAIAGDYISIYM